MDTIKSFKALLAVIMVIIFAFPVGAAAVGGQVSYTSESMDENTPEESTEPSEPSEPSESIEPSSESEAVNPPKPLNGFKTVNGKKYYYINGVKQTGLIKIKRNYYFFGKNGCMATGFRKLGIFRYYFYKSGKAATGFKKIGKHRYYFTKAGRAATGFRKIGKYRYCFSSKGYMLTGRRKVDGAHYCFAKNGRMRTGFIKIKGKIFYYEKGSGKRAGGFKKIKKHIYYFKRKNGAAITGFAVRKLKKKSFNVYFDKKGRLKTGTFKVGRTEYKASKKTGKIYSCRNLAKVICQMPEMPSGCEITSWTMMANFAGVKIDKKKAAKVMPKTRNPNTGFVGSPYTATGDTLVVFPNGLSSITQKYLGSYTNMTGCKLSSIKKKLSHKKLVMVWAKGLVVPWSHTVVLTGYDKKGLYFNDPFTGTKSYVSYKQFEKNWKGNGMMAMSY